MTKRIPIILCLVLLVVSGLIAAADEGGDVVLQVPDSSLSVTIGLSDAILLGVIEGLTEYLPISSTGHLILVSHALGLSRYEGAVRGTAAHFEKVPALDAFEIVIQIGAILAVLGIYRKRVGQMFNGLRGHDADGVRLMVLLVIAFLPAAVTGLALHGVIKQYLFRPGPVATGLAAGGIGMIVAQWYYGRGRARAAADICSMPLKAALLIGCAQCLALWPGMSRSMVTIVGGMAVGLPLVAAAEFSFLLALPTLGAATLYQLATDWGELSGTVGWGPLLTGIAVSAIVAAASVRWLIRWLSRHGLVPFGVYRMALAIAVMAYFLMSD